MQKVLIIKLGYSETLDPEIGDIPSLGDALRTTVILHCFKDYHVTWLADKKAYALLRANPYINRILFYNLTTVLQLQAEQFDVVVNLEKTPGICALTNSINAWSKYGFRFDSMAGEAKSYEGSHKAFNVYTDLNNKRQAKRIWQDVLFEMLGKKWKGEEYILEYKATSNLKYEIGLNFLVGKKWPNKVWHQEKWDDLYKMLIHKGYNVSLQQGQTNIEEYIEWIHSCKLIVTHDSLGLHIAIAFKKKIVALYGPTASHETYLYNLGSKVEPEGEYDCVPCLRPVCSRDVSCMQTITVDRVCSEIERVLAK